MAAPRAAHQATVLPSGAVLITGGCSGDHCGRVLASVELYDPARRSFRAASPMSIPRASHAATLLPDGRVLVCGGWNGERAVSSAETYDPATGAWTPVGDMAEARASLIAVPLLDGRVLIVGGGDGGLGTLATAEVFDPRTSAFSTVTPMHANHYLATGLADGRVLVTGGQGPDGGILPSAEIFDPDTDTFHATGDMATARVKQGAALLPDGRVLVLGGSDGRGYPGRMAATEIYDPETGAFSPGPDLQRARHKLRDALAVLTGGAVLVAGGAEVPEIYDPGRSSFVPVRGVLGGPMMFATATLLPGGDVLLLGGYDEHTQPSASAYLVRSGS